LEIEKNHSSGQMLNILSDIDRGILVEKKTTNKKYNIIACFFKKRCEVVSAPACRKVNLGFFYSGTCR
jgi:hypothetical protein